MRESIFILSIFLSVFLHGQKKVDFMHQGLSHQVKLPNKFPQLPDDDYNLVAIMKCYEQTKERLQKYFSEVEMIKYTLALSDFQYIQLLHQFSKSYKQNRNQQSMFLAALMELSGFEVELAYTRDRVFTFSKIEQDIFEISFVQLDESNFVNILLLLDDTYVDDENWYFNTNIYQKLHGRALRFESVRKHDQMTEKVHKDFNFEHAGELISLRIPVDKKVVDDWNAFPHLSENSYIYEKLSPETIAAFKQQLDPFLLEKTEKEQVELLVNFVRNGFQYQEDELFYGRSRPLTAEETLFYPFSDCEDRCALFFQLVQELLGLPVIAIGIPNHMTVAVGINTSERFSKEVEYRGTRYIICDPTGPEGSYEIGTLNIRYNAGQMQVIAEAQRTFVSN